MDIHDLIELITLEHVAEGIGLAAGVGILWGMFFGGGINVLLEILLSTT